MMQNIRLMAFGAAFSTFALAWQASSVNACSFYPGFNDFPIDKAAWEQSQKDIQASGVVNTVDSLPSPMVHVKKVVRGINNVGASCGDAGHLVIEVSLPAGSKYSLEELGVYFRLVEGRTPDQIFYDLPLAGIIEENKSTFIFRWLDGPPSRQKPINATVEAFFVTKGGEFGQQTEFVVIADSKGAKPARKDR